MIKVSILYPARAGARFDFAYYAQTHMPLSIRLLRAHPGFRGVSVERGIAAAAPGAAPAFVASCQFLFESTEQFLEAFGPHAALLQADMPNYTDIEPLIQFNEVVIAV